MFVASSALAQPQWSLLTSSPYNDYRSEDISFTDPETGWAVNGDGDVFQTTDSGTTWIRMASLNGYLRSTAFASQDLGWIGVLRSETQLYETRDGGQSFQDITSRIQPAIQGGICSLFAVSDQVVYGAGQFNSPAYLIKTTDGGQTWTSTSLAPLLNTAIDVYFFDENRGLAVGGVGLYGSDQIRARVIGTEDGGTTWTVRHTSDVPISWGWKLSFPTPEVGYMSIESYVQDVNAYILKTSDGGQSWQQIGISNAGSSGDMQGIGFLTPDIGWVSGRGVISMTTDGGGTWTRLNATNQLDGNVNRFRFLDGGLGFASGHNIHRLDARVTASDSEADDGWGFVSVQPNPVASTAQIRYRLAAPSQVRIEVVDLLGRTVATLVDGAERAGDQGVEWDIAAEHPAGLYLVRLQADGREWTQRLVVTR
ncbi:MAG: hypothetical protein Rubg2KO_35620 [Rubricoccaceae bacterium]